jgi:superoxide dismutase, Fe-Mn family
MAHYELPNLPYDYADLEPHLSARILELHHGKHHRAYVEGLNATLDKLAAARADRDLGAIVGLEKTLAFNLSGHVLHSLYWENLSPDGGGKPDGELAAAIDEHFGSFDGFQSQLTQATVTVQGSGWGALVWEPIGHRLVVTQIEDHQGNSAANGDNLLVIDAWEHAYYLQYLNARADYVQAMWNLVAWPTVASRFGRAVAATH